MRLGNQLLEVAFFEQGSSTEERVDGIDSIISEIALRGLHTYHDLLDATVAVDAIPIEALLLAYDPRAYAEEAWDNAQSLSAKVLSMNGALSSKEGVGASTEVAVHNVLWYGIAFEEFGRYVRLTTNAEDRSGEFGKRDGFDIIFRTDKRRWRIQVKHSGDLEIIKNKYGDDIIVVTPEMLLRDPTATEYDLHIAIATADHATLQFAWNNFLHELRTQKAPNGLRRVI